jgi:hypothetical protein
MGAIADDGQVDANILVDRRGIDVDMDLARLGRERIDAAGDAVIEARPDIDHHVAIMHRHIGFVGAVHAEHAEPMLVGSGEGAEPHQR